MTKNTINNFIKTTELYLRMNEKRDTQINFDESLPLMFSDIQIVNNYENISKNSDFFVRTRKQRTQNPSV